MSRVMKDSGIEWIGEVPEGWNLSKISNLYDQRIAKVSDKNFQPLSVTMKGIVPQLDTAAKRNEGDNRKLVLNGDFAINSRSDRRGSCGISYLDGSVSLINIVLSPRNKMNSKYYNWLFHTSVFADEFYRWGHGIVDDLWTTRWSEMKNISIPVPTLSEQQRIATFLDSKCGEVDSMIALQEEMISELQAYKQSVITEAVTQGLNPNVKMKGSGIEWIGEIPDEWKVCKLKYLLIIKSGDAITNSQLSDNAEIPVYGGGEILGFTKKHNADDNILVVGRVGARCGNVLYPKKPFFATYNAFLISTNMIVRYMYYLLLASNLNKLNTSNAQPLITASKIKNVHVPFIGLSEQQTIATYLDAKCSDIDRLITLKQEKIESLKAYKQSIIYEYVTGKKQVLSVKF